MANITIQEIFELRRNGQYEQAYEAVLPLYREHHGHYTTLCMFWTAADVLRLRTESCRFVEAEQILSSLRLLYPSLEDKDLSAAHTLNRLALLLATKEQEYHHLPADAQTEPTSFSLLDYANEFGMEYLSDEDWQSGEYNGHPTPSFGAKLLSRIFHEVTSDPCPDIDRLQQALTLTNMALEHQPHDRHLLRYQANLLFRTGDRKRAVALYLRLTRNSHEAYLFSELASMVDSVKEQKALLAKAIMLQKTEAFAQRDRMTLASLLRDSLPQHAAYELNRVLALRDSLGQRPSRPILTLRDSLTGITPASPSDQQELYLRLLSDGKLCA